MNITYLKKVEKSTVNKYTDVKTEYSVKKTSWVALFISVSGGLKMLDSEIKTIKRIQIKSSFILKF